MSIEKREIKDVLGEMVKTIRPEIPDEAIPGVVEIIQPPIDESVHEKTWRTDEERAETRQKVAEYLSSFDIVHSPELPFTLDD